MNPLYLDYEQLLIGNSKLLSPFNFYGINPGGANQKNALSCIRYGLEDLLQWDLDTCKKKFDRYTIQLMKMERLVEYISFPPEVEFGDPKYILTLLYPNDIHLNQKELIESMYQRVIDDKCQFPREYFLGQNGFYRFSICLCYLINNYCPVYDVEDLYSFFSSSEGRKFLDKYRLKVPMEHLNIDILKCIYTITDDVQSSYLYYCYYSFCHELSLAF